MKRLVLIALAVTLAFGAGCKERVQPRPQALVAGPSAPRPTAPGYGGVPVTAPAIAVAGPETVPGLPDYPGATRVSWQTKTETRHGFTSKVEARFTSSDSLGSVVAHYQRVIAEQGWAVLESTSKPTEVKWKLAKGTSQAEIEVDQDFGKPVEISLEREDR